MAVPGTSLRMFKKAFAGLLANQIPNFVYGSPAQASEVLGDDGSGVAAWWDDTVSAPLETPLMTAGVVWYDERIACTLVFQAIGLDTDADMETIDDRTAEALGKAMILLAGNPSGGVTDTTEVTVHEVVATQWRYVSGIPEGSANRAGRYELDIEVYARLRLA